MGIIDLVVKPLRKPRVTVSYPAGPADSVRSMRTPRFQPDRCVDEQSCVAACPTKAITVEATSAGQRRWALDYGRCIFCAECIRVCPALAVVGSGDFELDANSRADVVAAFLLEEVKRG